MAKKKNSPDQLALPGVELDDQQKFEFAQPGGGTPKKARQRNGNGDDDHLPPNLAEPVQVRVPSFSDPRRPKTCLEVDFPIVPINALSALEGNAGKPIYQMSKWWARRRGCVFRAMLIAAATEAPVRKGPDGTPVLDDQGLPVPDETEAAKAVWDVYYANHQKAGNFKHLKVLDCFMGGGTTLVEGSRLGFQLAGVDLNPVAWFVTKNELADTDPEEVKRFFDQIEAEVKPVIQPFYVTDCPRGHKGRWHEVAGSADPADDRLMPPEFDPLNLPPEERKKYRYEGPEVIYTFWAKHGPCTKPGCGHRTPVFRSPVIAEKKLGVKYIELKCKECKTVFHAELGDARMAPAAQQVVLPNEAAYTALSQPFAKPLLEYAKGKKEEKKQRAAELFGMVGDEPGLKCPNCGAFAGQYLRDVLNNHRQAATAKAIDKKHLRIQPPRNSTKPVYCYLLIHPDWLKGSPGTIDGQELGGYPDAPVEATSRWYEERLKNLRFIEVRGQIKLSEDTSHLSGGPTREPTAQEDSELPADEKAHEAEPVDRKEYGLPHFVVLADATRVNTKRGTVPKQSHFTCGACGHQQDLRESLQQIGHAAPLAAYALQGYSPVADAEGHVYGGRFFAAPAPLDIMRLSSAELEWHDRRHEDLSDFWPREEIPHTYMTHHANFALPDQGYTHWWKMFNSRQILVHSELLRALRDAGNANEVVRQQILGAFQQYLRNQNMFCIYDVGYDKLAPFFSNPNYAPKSLTLENAVFTSIGRGNFRSVRETVEEGLEWARNPWESYFVVTETAQKSVRLDTLDPVVSEEVELRCASASDLNLWGDETFDLVITDPPFGDNVFYSDLANFFHVWLRLDLQDDNAELFGPVKTPSAQEALKPRLLAEEEANEHYRSRLLACWIEAFRVIKAGGILAFTFHHSEDALWGVVLSSLFEAGFILEQTYPIASDEQKGEGGNGTVDC